MISPFSAQAYLGNRIRTGRLYLNDVDVGSVTVRGQDGSWIFGDFVPAADFVHFAPIFGRWSLLMHAEDVGERLSPETSEELRHIERAMDAIHAAVLLLEPQEWRSVGQLNIDGPLIEWKEG